MIKIYLKAGEMMIRRTGGFEEEGVQVVKPIKPQRESLMDKEVSLKINPKRLMRIGVVIVVLLGVFFLGRFSANNFELTGLATSEVQAIEPEVPAVPTPEVETVTEEPEEEISASEPTNEQELPAVEEAEELIYSGPYKKVSIDVRGIDFEWKETWGKMLGFTYSIKNDEEGTILPGYFTVILEGYKDQDRRATLPEINHKVKSGQIQAGTITLDKAFNYNEATAGNPENIKVSVILFDTNLKPIASHHQEFNLKR